MNMLQFLNSTIAVPIETDTTKMEKVLKDENGDVKIVSADVWHQFTDFQIAKFLVDNVVFVAPTEELIDFLDKFIGNKKAIEICAGKGFVGRELDIPMTDSYMHVTSVELKMRSIFSNNPLITKYPKDVKKLEATSAVKLYKPEVVIACYGTHRSTEGMGCNWGVDYEKIIKLVHYIVLVGNKYTHGENPLMEVPHQEIDLPGLITRSPNKDLNRIFIWENQSYAVRTHKHHKG